MQTFRGKNTAKQCARAAMKVGLLLTDAKLWSGLTGRFSDRADDFSDAVKRKYKHAAGRFEDARGSLRGDRHWAGPTISFLGGIAVGTGIGILFAPKSGAQTRASLRDTMADVKNRVSCIGSEAPLGPGETQMTGTEGD